MRGIHLHSSFATRRTRSFFNNIILKSTVHRPDPWPPQRSPSARRPCCVPRARNREPAAASRRARHLLLCGLRFVLYLRLCTCMHTVHLSPDPTVRQYFPTGIRQGSDRDPTVFRQGSDRDPTVFRQCSDSVPTVSDSVRQCSDSVPTVFRQCPTAKLQQRVRSGVRPFRQSFRQSDSSDRVPTVPTEFRQFRQSPDSALRSDSTIRFLDTRTLYSCLTAVTLQVLTHLVLNGTFQACDQCRL